MDKVKGEEMRRGKGIGGTEIILHLPQDNIQTISRIVLYIASVGKAVKVTLSDMPPQVLVHTLVM